MIFEDTIANNISFGRNISEEQMISAAQQACAYEFIMEKPQAFAFEAAIKGANFSGGQKQRLFIARALASKPEILILDDSSSALDYKTDAKLRRVIQKELVDTTFIMVAQRISSVMQLNHILVLEEGEVIGYGTHKELLETCSVYREIYQSQMGEEI